MKKTFVVMLALLCLLLCGCGFGRDVRRAEEKIASIGIVTAESGPVIEEAEAAMNALSRKERERVKNAADLTRAKEDLRRAIEEKEERERQERHEALRRSLIGKWEYNQDVTGEYCLLLDRMMESVLGYGDLHMADYVDRIALRQTFSLLENGTYRIGTDEAQREAFLNSFMDPLGRYYFDLLREIIASELAAQGIVLEDPWSDESWVNATGMPFETLLANELGMDFNAYLQYILQMLRDSLGQLIQEAGEELGNYDVEEGKLLLSDALEKPVSPDVFVSCTLESGRLTLTGYSNVAIFGSAFPIELEKVD